jgi:hypothetical protein
MVNPNLIGDPEDFKRLERMKVWYAMNDGYWMTEMTMRLMWAYWKKHYGEDDIPECLL